MYTIILSATITEANAHAAREKLKRGSWRWPARPASIKGLRVAAIHELPSWRGRRDRHGIEVVLKRAKTTRTVFTKPERARILNMTPEEISESAAKHGERFGLESEELAELEKHLMPEGWEPSGDLATDVAAPTVAELKSAETEIYVPPEAPASFFEIEDD